MPSPMWFWFLERCLREVILRVKQCYIYAVKEGRAYDTSKRFSIGAGGSLDIIIINPSDNTQEATIIEIEITATGTCFVDMYQDSEIVAQGTEVQAMPKIIGETPKNKVKIFYGGTYNPGTRVHETIVPGGTKPPGIIIILSPPIS